MSSTKRGKTREKNDLYKTPEPTFKSILPILPKKVEFYEPCAGDGRLIKWLQDSGRVAAGSDLNVVEDFMTTMTFGVDFLKDNTLREFIVTNPPFSIAKEFVAHSLEVADETMMLLRLNFLGSQKRKEWWKLNEPDAVFVLSERPDFTGGGGDSCEYGFFYWGFRYNGMHHV